MIPTAATVFPERELGVEQAPLRFHDYVEEGTMLEYTRRTEPIEKPSRLQLAIMEWQRELVDKARMGHDDGGRTGTVGRRRASTDGLG